MYSICINICINIIAFSTSNCSFGGILSVMKASSQSGSGDAGTKRVTQLLFSSASIVDGALEKDDYGSEAVQAYMSV